MKLYLLRHAEAEPHAGATSDEARQLTERGKDRIAQAARGLRRLGVEFDALLSSPLTRALQTAEIVAAEYNNSPPVQTMLELATGVAPAKVVAAFASMGDHREVMVVGHEPQLSAVASLLLTGSSERVSMQLKKGSCVALELPERSERGAGELLWMMTQGQLRKLRKRPS
jgi:phosphohistidine phosphatase